MILHLDYLLCFLTPYYISPRHFYYLLLGFQVSLETEAPENSIGVISLPSSLMSNLPANDVELASRVQFNFFETPALFQVKLPQTGFALSFIWEWGTYASFNPHIS